MKFSKFLLNLILPPRCISCGAILREENGFCPDCFSQINFITAPYCAKCGMPFTSTLNTNDKTTCPNCFNHGLPYLRMCRSAIKYDENSKHAILALKFLDKTENAKVLAKWLKLAGRDILKKKPDLLIPVPLHYQRLVKRRYNQSALLGAELSRLCGVELDTSSLVKHKATLPQVSFSGRERMNNVKGVFSVKTPEKIVGRHVVLIDDVYTTGSTIRECAAVLKKAGAASVDAITVARVCL